MTRTIGIVTLSRSEYGILRAVIRNVLADQDLRLMLFVGGSHLSPEFGRTVQEIEREKFPITERIECLLSGDTPESISKSMGLTIAGFSQAFARNLPDILLLTGDRYEMAAVALAAVPFNVPIAHLDGGAVTQGAFDDKFRNAMTKLSHLHLCYTTENAKRVRQMGEEAWRIWVTGNPALDSIAKNHVWSRDELADFGIKFDDPPLLVVFHPVTTECEHTDEYTDNLLFTFGLIRQPIIFVLTNPDTTGRRIIRKIRGFVERSMWAQAFTNLAPEIYYSLMHHAAAIIGNSSSGIMEAPSFELPCVNIGTRQAGRQRAANVIDVGYGADEILDGIERAISPEFRNSLRGLINPYGDGKSAGRIVSLLKSILINQELLIKKAISESL